MCTGAADAPEQAGSSQRSEKDVVVVEESDEEREEAPVAKQSSFAHLAMSDEEEDDHDDEEGMEDGAEALGLRVEAAEEEAELWAEEAAAADEGSLDEEEQTLPECPAPLAEGDRVSIFGVKSRPDLNGDLAVCVKHDAVKGRWQVRLMTGEEISLAERVLTAAPMKKKTKKSKDKKSKDKKKGNAQGGALKAEADEALAKELKSHEKKKLAKDKAKAEREEKAKKQPDAVAAAHKVMMERRAGDDEDVQHRKENTEVYDHRDARHMKGQLQGSVTAGGNSGNGGTSHVGSRSSYTKSKLKP